MEIYLLTSSSPGLFIGKISTSGFSHLNRASVNRNFSLVLPSSEIWIYFLQWKQIFIIKIKTRNLSKCSMADSIYTYINQTPLLNKNTFTLSLATCHHYCLSRKMLLSDDTRMWFTHNVREITPSIVSTPKLNLCKIIVGRRWIWFVIDFPISS